MSFDKDSWDAALWRDDRDAEITRPRNELHIAQEWSARVIAGHEEDIREITALRAENERLRAALQWYADPERYKPHPHGLAFERRDISYVARAALTQQEGER